MINEKVSIIMGVYNCSQTIDEAIDSILKQTYSDWEFIICDDCSTDNTYKILLNYKEEYPNKFVLLKNEKNLKLAYTLNRCLKHVKGKYIARMDGDDLSEPNRFEKQVLFLKEKPNNDLVGTAMSRFNEDGLIDVLYPIENPNRYSLRKKLPFFHATIMTYKYVYDAVRGYTVSDRTQKGQDVDLWYKFYHAGFNGCNIMQPLYKVRENRDAIRRRNFKIRVNSCKTVLYGYRLLKYPIHWYLKPILYTFFKVLIPYGLTDFYRKYQRHKFRNVNIK